MSDVRPGGGGAGTREHRVADQCAEHDAQLAVTIADRTEQQLVQAVRQGERSDDDRDRRHRGGEVMRNQRQQWIHDACARDRQETRRSKQAKRQRRV